MINIELKEELEQLDLENILLVSIVDRDVSQQEKEDCYSVTLSKKDYLENKEIVDDFIKRLCTYERQWIKTLYFDSKYHMSEEYFNLLKENKSLERIMLNNYELTESDFNILKENDSIQEIETTIISPELSECYDKRLSQVMKREVTRFLSVKNIIYDDEIRINGPLSEEQAIDICKLLERRTAKGNIKFCYFDDTKYLKMIIDKVFELEQDRKEKDKLTISIEDRKSFDYKTFTDEEQNSNLEVLTETDEPTDMNAYIRVENKIKEILEPIEKHKDELSPFEILLWLYNIVATYREYKVENTDEDYRISRFLNKLLFTDKMVCVGYSYLLSDTAKRHSLDVWENFACDKANTRKDTEYNHYNNLVFLQDEKYDINGVYLMDTTFDNHSDKDLFVFNHFMLTPEKYAKHLQQMYSAGYSMLNIEDKDEFLRIIKTDKKALSSVLGIILKYFKNDELFKIECSNDEALNLYYIDSIDRVYELAQSINIEPITEDKIRRALIHIEKIKNSNITVDELEEKLDKTFEIYRKRDAKIYGSNNQNEKQKTLQ